MAEWRSNARGALLAAVLLGGAIAVAAAGADVSPDGTTDLHLAVRDADLTRTEALLRAGASPSATKDRKSTRLNSSHT